MSSVYPRAAVEVIITPASPAEQVALAARVIDARETNPHATKAHLIGGVLQGSDDVAGFERAWAAVEAERVSMASITARASDYVSLKAFEDALIDVAFDLDFDIWISCALEAAGVETFAELKEPDSAEL